MDDVRAFIDAVEAFWRHVSAVGWTALAIGLLLHVLKIVLRVRAWQNIVRAAYPGTEVRYGPVFGSYVAGVGVNSIAPARGGDLVKLFLLKRRVEGSTYPTLGSTLLAETVFDFVVAAALFLWALKIGLLPGVPDLPSLPAFDWTYVIEHPRLSVLIGSVLVALLILGIAWGSRRVLEFWQRVRQGLAILRDWRAFVTGVVSWQALSWAARVGSVFWFLKAFHIEATLRTALAVILVQSLSTLLPVTPGGVGTQQAVLVFVLSGTAAASAVLGFSVGMQFATVAANVVLGFGAIFLMIRTLRWRRHLAAADGLVSPEPAAAPSRTAVRG